LLWDFDGVIFDSMSVKADGFKELFKNYDKTILNNFIEFHYQNGGMSRFDKIKYFYTDLINKNISDEKINSLAKKYGEIIKKSLFNKDNLILDSLEFIRNNYKKYRFHIVSGAEHNELNELCKFLEIENYFITIEGSPTKKSILIDNLIHRFDYKKDEVVLIGDSFNDYKAATKNNISFFGYNNLALKKFNYIEKGKFNEIFDTK
jgi:phosphoglycolate phosphatase-like HAD superfamily hydrolase